MHLLEPRYSTSKPITADTLEDLVDQLDIDDKEQAVKTLHAFNAAARDADEGFDPTSKDGVSTRGLTPEKTNWGIRLDTPPFHAYSATGGITFTFGGVKVNENTPGDRHGLAAAEGAVRLRRNDRRAVLRQLSGRHGPGVGRNVRPHRGTQRRRGAGMIPRALDRNRGKAPPQCRLL